MDAGQEHRGVQAMVGDLVAVGVRDSFDQCVGAEPSQVIGHLSGADQARCQAAELGGDGTQVAVGEPVGLEPEDQQRGQQGVAALLSQPQPWDAGAGRRGDRVGEGMQVAGSADRVVVESLDAQQAPVGFEGLLARSCGFGVAGACRR